MSLASLEGTHTLVVHCCLLSGLCDDLEVKLTGNMEQQTFHVKTCILILSNPWRIRPHGPNTERALREHLMVQRSGHCQKGEWEAPGLHVYHGYNPARWGGVRGVAEEN